MDEYRECEECGQWKSTSRYAINDRIELHHTVFRSQLKSMENVPINHKYICSRCHRDHKVGVHHNKEKDLEYKQELQVKLQTMFTHDYYTIHQIRIMLDISKKEAEKLTKRLKLYKEGYSAKELIFHMMGDRNYLEVEE
jgi:hypothetical protein